MTIRRLLASGYLVRVRSVIYGYDCVVTRASWLKWKAGNAGRWVGSRDREWVEVVEKLSC